MLISRCGSGWCVRRRAGRMARQPTQSLVYLLFSRVLPTQDTLQGVAPPTSNRSSAQDRVAMLVPCLRRVCVGPWSGVAGLLESVLFFCNMEMGRFIFWRVRSTGRVQTYRTGCPPLFPGLDPPPARKSFSTLETGGRVGFP